MWSSTRIKRCNAVEEWEDDLTLFFSAFVVVE